MSCQQCWYKLEKNKTGKTGTCGWKQKLGTLLKTVGNLQSLDRPHKDCFHQLAQILAFDSQEGSYTIQQSKYTREHTEWLVTDEWKFWGKAIHKSCNTNQFCMSLNQNNMDSNLLFSQFIHNGMKKPDGWVWRRFIWGCGAWTFGELTFWN